MYFTTRDRLHTDFSFSKQGLMMKHSVESAKECYGSKRAVFPLMMMMMIHGTILLPKLMFLPSPYNEIFGHLQSPLFSS
jgi:hypothetical protein